MKNSSLKRGIFIVEAEKNKKSIVFFALFLLIAFLILFLVIPDIDKNNLMLYKIRGEVKLVTDNEDYLKIANGSLNIDDVKTKLDKGGNNLLQSSDPGNFLYIENYINKNISKYGQDFHFGDKVNFVNSGNNDITIPLVFTNSKDLYAVLLQFSNDGYLGKDNKIVKEGNIYKLDLNLNFYINE